VPLGPSNSLLLPAHLSLELGRPLPLSSALAARIAALTQIAWLDRGEDTPLLSLIARLESKGSLDPTNNRGQESGQTLLIGIFSISRNVCAL
jgi:hypothetical protein